MLLGQEEGGAPAPPLGRPQETRYEELQDRVQSHRDGRGGWAGAVESGGEKEAEVVNWSI